MGKTPELQVTITNDETASPAASVISEVRKAHDEDRIEDVEYAVNEHGYASATFRYKVAK